jgi:Ni/Fe-hydrogenase subunit HybB-like protein
MEILGAVLEFLFEILIQGLAEIPFDIALNQREKKGRARDFRVHPAAWIALAIVTGSAMGWISSRVWSAPWPHTATGRLSFVLLSPLVTGAASYLINRLRVRQGQDWRHPWFHAGCATLFAMALAVTRLLTLP